MLIFFHILYFLSSFLMLLFIHPEHFSNCFFIDTGLTAIASDIRQLPEALESAPKIVEHYMLTSSESGESEELLPVGSTCYVQMLVSTARPKVVRVFSDANCQYPVRPVEALPPRLDCSMVGESIANITILATLKTGYLSYVESSQNFWIQADCDQINEVFSVLEKPEDLPILKTFEIGDVCATQWSEDDKFYRSRVVRPESGGESCIIHFEYLSQFIVSFLFHIWLVGCLFLLWLHFI